MDIDLRGRLYISNKYLNYQKITLNLIHNAYTGSKNIIKWGMDTINIDSYYLNHYIEIAAKKGKLDKSDINYAKNPLDYLKTTNEPDDFKRFAVNYIHSIDAYIMRHVIYNMYPIPVMDIHDSFGVPIDHVNTLRNKVHEAYIDVLLNNQLDGYLYTYKNELISKGIPYEE
ncbi:hypothetical protein HDU92_001381 [Lobulomyces angularis]|nr:hypothetical protein HDU92_001381 [Lobulomyces angularis]